MPTATSPSNRFTRRVRAEMVSQKLSVRGLARKMDPENLDRARRNLHRWLDEGIVPSRTSRIVVADALGIPEAELADDEEDDPSMREAFRLFVDLMSQIGEARRSQNSKSVVA